MAARMTIPVAMAFFAVCSCVTAADDVRQSPLDRFLNDAPKAWAQAAEMNRNVEVVITELTRNRSQAFDWSSHRQLMVKAAGGKVVQQIITLPLEGNFPAQIAVDSNRGRSRVDAINEWCSFSLLRRGTAPWVLIAKGPVGGETFVDNETIAADIDRLGRTWIAAPWSVDDWPLASMCQSPRFRATHADTVVEDGRSLVEVSFSIFPSATQHSCIAAANSCSIRTRIGPSRVPRCCGKCQTTCPRKRQLQTSTVAATTQFRCVRPSSSLCPKVKPPLRAALALPRPSSSKSTSAVQWPTTSSPRRLGESSCQMSHTTPARGCFCQLWPWSRWWPVLFATIDSEVRRRPFDPPTKQWRHARLAPKASSPNDAR